MQDEYRRAMHKKLGWTKSLSCPCCNWTIGRNKRRNRIKLKKQVRANMKADLRKERIEHDRGFTQQ